MKVLITIGESTFPNPFVRTLAAGIRQKGVDVTCSVSDFWNKWQLYDIIHIQWPHILVRDDMTNIEPLRAHFELIKQSGKKILVTCHNLNPHYSKDVIRASAYSLAYQYADAVVHLGKYSLNLFKKIYPKTYHTIILHHIYDQLYDNLAFPNRNEAINKLKLDPSYRYILSMGAFRDEEERELVLQVYTNFTNKRVRILAPGFVIRRYSWRYPLTSYKSLFKYYSIKHKYPGVICEGHFVSDDMMPYYYAASDIAMIHRKEILNSGNLPFALMMGKVVVGPNTGNVGLWLNELDNPTFDISDLNTIKSAVECAFSKSQQGFGEMNKQYAYEHLITAKIANQYVELYFFLYKEGTVKSKPAL